MLKRLYKKLRYYNLPYCGLIYRPLRSITNIIKLIWGEMWRILWYTPIFKSYLTNRPKRIYVFSKTPQVWGKGEFSMGENCRISGHTTITFRGHGKEPAVLKIGDSVGIGWSTTIAVGSKLIIGNNVRIASQVFIAGYYGHHIDAKKRALDLPDDDAQVKDIIIEDDVWIATGVKILSGVKIGSGTIVGAGSVVTKSMPANSIVAGNPAKVVKAI